MDDITDLKSAWKNQNFAEKYEHSDILKILNKNSGNHVKFFVLMGFSEFILMAAITVYYFIFGDETSSFLHILEKTGIAYTQENIKSLHVFFDVMSIIGLVLTAFFTLKFYTSYRKIKVEDDVKSFVQKVIDVKRGVKAFTVLNILLILISLCFFAGFAIYLAEKQNVHIDRRTDFAIITGIFVAIAIGAFIFWVYYRLAYGITVKKLNRTLDQIKKIEP